MKESWFSRHAVALMVGGLIALLTVGMTVVILVHNAFETRCALAGGKVAQMNCQTAYINQCNTIGTGVSASTYCVMTPMQSCDDVCIGGKPESL